MVTCQGYTDGKWRGWDLNPMLLINTNATISEPGVSTRLWARAVVFFTL